MLINNDTYQRETLSDRPIRQPLNHKTFGNLFCNSQKSFHTFPGTSDSNDKGYRSFLKLNNGICKMAFTKNLDVNFFVNAIGEFKEWSIASIIRVGRSGEV